MKVEDFISPIEHFQRLVNSMPQAHVQVWNQCQHQRIEMGYRGRNLLLYQFKDRKPYVLEEITVQDFICNDEDGASAEIRVKSTGALFEIGYQPTLILGHPVFMCLPLHMQIKMDTTPSGNRRSLGFPILIRTLSRFHLRERGVTYLETGVSFSREFNTAKPTV